MTTSKFQFRPEIAKKVFEQGFADEGVRVFRAGEWNETYRKFYNAGWEKSKVVNAPARQAARDAEIELFAELATSLRRIEGRF